jgi:hypothetical protein
MWCRIVADSPDTEYDRDCKNYRQMTNADHIRAMTDEELEDFIFLMDVNHNTGERLVDGVYLQDGFQFIRDWLKKPYEGGEDDD